MSIKTKYIVSILSFTARFPVELEKRNFPDICGRDTIITNLSCYFWEDHGNVKDVENRDFRLTVAIHRCF